MCIKHTHIAWWAGHTDYVNYETGGAFDVAHAYTLITIEVKNELIVVSHAYQYTSCSHSCMESDNMPTACSYMQFN